MANLLGHKAWNRTKKCKRVNCCNRPRWSQHATRQREERQWRRDWFEETPLGHRHYAWGLLTHYDPEG